MSLSFTSERGARIRRRIQHELLPLLRDYVDHRLAGPATSELQGLSDRITSRVEGAAAR